MTINILPDEVLLLIFHFDRVTYLGESDPSVDRVSVWYLAAWHRLVHVCWRWRSILFASPNFLDLKLVCRPWSRVELTGIWPLLPIVVTNRTSRIRRIGEVYDFGAAHAYFNRVCEIDLRLTSPQLRQLASSMQVQFPALKRLMLYYNDLESSLVPLPESLLGGSAPHLQSLTLHCIRFSTLPKFLLSTNDLVHLALRDIPDAGFISPEGMVTGLAVLASLKSLTIEFKYTRLPPYQRQTPLVHAVLPSLTYFRFSGNIEYLFGLIAQFDAPLLDTICITFFDLSISPFPWLAEFMERTTRFRVFNDTQVEVESNRHDFRIEFHSPTRTTVEKLRFRILFRSSSWNFRRHLTVAHVLTKFFPSIYMAGLVEHLYISKPR